MGNCLETWKHGQQGEKKEHQEDEELKVGGEAKEDFGKSGFRVKLVLTREELEWLMLQLKEKGGKKLEYILGEIENGRGGKVEGWKPSLESIMEDPEVYEMDK
ncbi:PREDICTED: uncharacterized protein LOC104600432 [Nelumbo nucifera]|uniref:Uncharacterized protein LOC104600432 n=2 Tax=Nelumbo nucifera TaxID=4432 RepID=A0A1U8A3J5_NELNU|nr:PREDICTED: uncharacterized protein LOC104600432 [Nelumbo nucifera]DAD19200.1 TPA_asm: hypothetical protein HUJ06_020663 [Nelumbo nucifera]